MKFVALASASQTDHQVSEEHLALLPPETFFFSEETNGV
jgi:hypothetical protein